MVCEYAASNRAQGGQHFCIRRAGQGLKTRLSSESRYRVIIIIVILQVGKHSIPDNSNVLAKFPWNSIKSTCHIYVYLELNVFKNKNN